MNSSKNLEILLKRVL